MSDEKYGFVYVWRDKKHNRLYVGCHWGTETDGYLCSSNWMRDSYKRRPDDFKRRIVQRVSDRTELLTEEHKWLTQIKDEELGKKFYNLNKHHFGHWASTDRAEEIRQKISDKVIGRVRSPEHMEKCKAGLKKASAARKGTKLTKEHSLALQNGGKKYRESEAGKLQLSEAALGNKNMLGKHHSESSKKKMSEKHSILALELNYSDRLPKNQTGSKNPFFGKHHSAESIQKMRISKKGTSMSNQTKEKIADAQTGSKNAFFGRSWTPEMQQKRAATIAKKKSSVS